MALNARFYHIAAVDSFQISSTINILLDIIIILYKTIYHIFIDLNSFVLPRASQKMSHHPNQQVHITINYIFIITIVIATTTFNVMHISQIPPDSV